MAAYDFPNSPSDGDTVTVSGVTYTYSSAKTRWDGAAESSSSSGSSTTVYATIDDLPLSGASTGDQAYVSGNNRLYIWNGTGWYNIALINTTPSISGALGTYALATDGTATTVTITATDPEGINYLQYCFGHVWQRGDCHAGHRIKHQRIHDNAVYKLGSCWYV